MSNTPATPPAETSLSSNDLAMVRTRLSIERTMMAWIRTAVSLISFGFTIYKFFNLSEKQVGPTGIIGPRRYAMLMIGTGLFALAAAVTQHWRERGEVRKAGDKHYSLATVIAGLVAVLGVLALTTVILHE